MNSVQQIAFMIIVEITGPVAKAFNDAHLKWIDDKSYPHSFNDYLREHYHCTIINIDTGMEKLKFENDKMCTWFLLQ